MPSLNDKKIESNHYTVFQYYSKIKYDFRIFESCFETNPIPSPSVSSLSSTYTWLWADSISSSLNVRAVRTLSYNRYFTAVHCQLLARRPQLFDELTSFLGWNRQIMSSTMNRILNVTMICPVDIFKCLGMHSLLALCSKLLLELSKQVCYILHSKKAQSCCYSSAVC